MGVLSIEEVLAEEANTISGNGTAIELSGVLKGE
jgi:hypothetical protein